MRPRSVPSRLTVALCAVGLLASLAGPSSATDDDAALTQSPEWELGVSGPSETAARATAAPGAADGPRAVAAPSEGSGASGEINLQLVGSYPPQSIKPAQGSALNNPPSHPIVKRDCGFSVPLSGGRTLWLYCDSTNVDENRKFTYFYTSTAAIAYDNAPHTVHEATDTKSHPVPRPYPFLVTSSVATPCVGPLEGQRHVMWPNSATVVPWLAGRERVVMWFTNLCAEKGATTLAQYTRTSIGLAEWIHDPSDPAPHTKPIQATVVERDVFPIEADGEGQFGEASVYGGASSEVDSNVYLFRCGQTIGCEVARALRSELHLLASYRYWNGSTWVQDRSSAAAVPLSGPPPASALNVAYLPAMGVYAMSGFAPPGAFLSDIHVRVSKSVLGPWGPPVTIPRPDCTDAPGCYAGHVQPQLSGPDTITTSAYVWWYHHDRGGQIRTMTSRVYLDPPLDGICQSTFYDIGYDHLFCKEIRWFGAEGITLGYLDGSFRPVDKVTRGAMAAWFYRWSGSPAVPSSAPTFTDVPKTHLFYDAIRWAAAEGITVGFSDGTFRPSASTTRQAMAAFFYRSAGAPSGPFPNPKFKDVSDNHLLFDEISWFADLGITQGYTDGTFRPSEAVRRQAVAAFFYRYTGQS